MSNIKIAFVAFSFLSVVFFASMYAGAMSTEAIPQSVIDKIPEHALAAAAETHVPLRLKPRKPQFIQLDEEVGDVTVDEKSANVTAVLYNKKAVAFVPKVESGAAHITVFDKQGKPIMARYIIISDPLQKYTRIRETCKPGENSASCGKKRTFYCPNLCYETRLVGLASNR